MNRPGVSWCVSLLCSTPLLAQPKPAAPKSASSKPSAAAAETRTSRESPAKLPVRRVVLYKNGVGYFEHLGRVVGRQDVHIGAQIEVFTRNGTVTPEMARTLQKIAAQKAVVRKLEEDMANRQKDIDRIVADQARVRENMKTLKGSSEEKALIQRYTSQLDQQETQLESLRKNIQDTEARRDKANDGLENRIDKLQLESRL